VRARFLAAVAERPQTEPYPVDHCDLCDFRRLCEEEWERCDHLHRVAGMRRDQISRLASAGITTLAGLAAVAPDTAVRQLAPETFAGLREQAQLQLESAAAGEIRWPALLVCSPRLLEARCRPHEEMQLVNALCRLVEVAQEQAA
jgi:uncharacterized protein